MSDTDNTEPVASGSDSCSEDDYEYTGGVDPIDARQEPGWMDQRRLDMLYAKVTPDTDPSEYEAAADPEPESDTPWFWRGSIFNSPVLIPNSRNHYLSKRLKTWDDFPYRNFEMRGYEKKRMLQSIWYYALFGFEWDKAAGKAKCFWCGYVDFDSNVGTEAKKGRKRPLHKLESMLKKGALCYRSHLIHTYKEDSRALVPLRCRFMTCLMAARAEVKACKACVNPKWSKRQIWECAEHLRFFQWEHAW